MFASAGLDFPILTLGIKNMYTQVLVSEIFPPYNLGKYHYCHFTDVELRLRHKHDQDHTTHNYCNWVSSAYLLFPQSWRSRSPGKSGVTWWCVISFGDF